MVLAACLNASMASIPITFEALGPRLSQYRNNAFSISKDIYVQHENDEDLVILLITDSKIPFFPEFNKLRVCSP
jgi:hypothetical protein